MQTPSVPMMAEDQDTPSAVTDLDSEYEILGELGRGGMAVVYLARDRELGREVAIKIIRAQFLEDEEAMARFAREARTVAQLNHPGVVAIHAVKRLVDGSLALVMQHIRGRTLKEAIRQDGPLPVDTVEQVLRDVAEALECAHARGIVHRDVKPENILLDEATGRALLFDFGIARSADSRTNLTLTGMALGTPAYMSPEQIDGAEVDGRSDIYSLGLVGWEMLTGRRPWEGEGLYTVIFKQKNEELPAVETIRPETPEQLRTAIEGALQKDRELRWSCAQDFADSLAAVGTGARKKRSRAAKERMSRVVAAVEVARERRSAAALPDAETVRYRRPEHEGTVTAPRPRERSRRPMRTGIAIAVLLLFSGSAAVIAAINQRPDGGNSATGERPAPVSEETVLTSGSAPESPALPTVDSLAAADSLTQTDSVPSVAMTDTATLAAASPATAPQRDSVAPAVVATPAPAERVPDTATAPPVTRQPEPAPAASETRTAVAEGGTVVAGGMHSCLLTSAGEGLCWGGNDRGQLGNGSTARRSDPAPVAGDVRFRTIAAGVSHTCGIARNGDTYCWGANESGQLGDGSSSARAAPVPVASSRRFSRLWSGMSHNCGLTSGGDAFCWGSNSNGQLGDGSRTDRSTPARVAAESRFGSLAVGWKHTCGVSSNGTALCWGQNASGQLGDGGTADRVSPAPVEGGARFQRLAAGSAHSCGITTAGEIMCWGRNASGQLGDGSTTDRLTPTGAQSSQTFASITAGSTHTCALTRGGDAYCWGRNNYGQLGDGSTTDRAVPVKVAGGQSFTSIHASGAHTCGTTSQGEQFCWGYNVEGQLGDGTRGHRARPVRVGA